MRLQEKSFALLKVSILLILVENFRILNRKNGKQVRYNFWDITHNL